MKIYTSYFAKIPKLPKEMVCISIALYAPKWYHGYTCSLLAPTKQILDEWKKDSDEEKYRRNFFSYVLDGLNAQNLVKMFKEKIGDRDIILLCYESSEKFCHRHIVAEWLNKNGIQCEEIGE